MAAALFIDTPITVAGVYTVPVDTASISFVCTGADGSLYTEESGNAYPLLRGQHQIFNSDSEGVSCVLSGAAIYLDPNGGTISIMRTKSGNL